MVQFSSVAQSCPTLCDPMNRSMPGLPVHHQLPEFTQTHVHRVSDAIQPSHLLSSPLLLPQSLPASESFPMSQLFSWGGQSTGVSASASFPPKKSQRLMVTKEERREGEWISSEYGNLYTYIYVCVCVYVCYAMLSCFSRVQLCATP